MDPLSDLGFQSWYRVIEVFSKRLARPKRIYLPHTPPLFSPVLIGLRFHGQGFSKTRPASLSDLHVGNKKVPAMRQVYIMRAFEM